MECKFCKILAYKNKKEDYYFNQILLETANFFVIPALGAIVPGYVLIITKKCLNSMAEIPKVQRTELKGLLSDLERILGVFSERISIFEHGSSSKGIMSSACITHAHLHVVPRKIEAKKWITNATLFPTINTFFDSAISKKSYLMLGSSTNNIYGSEYNDEPCQFFRRVCASEFPYFIEWDYLVEHHGKNIIETINVFKKL